MSQGRVKHYPGKNRDVGPRRADTTQTSLVANQVDRSSEWKQENSGGADGGDHANGERRQNGDAVTLYHSISGYRHDFPANYASLKPWTRLPPSRKWTSVFRI